MACTDVSDTDTLTLVVTVGLDTKTSFPGGPHQQLTGCEVQLKPVSPASGMHQTNEEYVLDAARQW